MLELLDAGVDTACMQALRLHTWEQGRLVIGSRPPSAGPRRARRVPPAGDCAARPPGSYTLPAAWKPEMQTRTGRTRRTLLRPHQTHAQTGRVTSLYGTLTTSTPIRGSRGRMLLIVHPATLSFNQVSATTLPAASVCTGPQLHLQYTHLGLCFHGSHVA